MHLGKSEERGSEYEEGMKQQDVAASAMGGMQSQFLDNLAEVERAISQDILGSSDLGSSEQ